jgi:hypothetical protein
LEKPDEKLENEKVNEELTDTADSKKTRSGRVYKVNIKTLPTKYAETVTACTVRAVLVPKLVPEPEAKPAFPILKRRSRINFLHLENEEESYQYKDDDWSEKVIDRVYNYRIHQIRSILRSDRVCVKGFFA